MQLQFVRSESTQSYFGALEGYLTRHGCPVTFYSDKHTVFRIAKPDAVGGQGMTQFGRALAELNIEVLCANLSQANGRTARCRTAWSRNCSSSGSQRSWLPMRICRASWSGSMVGCASPCPAWRFASAPQDHPVAAERRSVPP
jgi:hypothetical protein